MAIMASSYLKIVFLQKSGLNPPPPPPPPPNRKLTLYCQKNIGSLSFINTLVTKQRSNNAQKFKGRTCALTLTAETHICTVLKNARFPKNTDLPIRYANSCLIFSVFGDFICFKSFKHIGKYQKLFDRYLA